MTEAQFTDALRKKLKSSVYTLKLNLRFMRGVPDCWYSGSKTDLWTEHKFLKKLPPVLDLAGKQILSVHQQIWLRDRHSEGRNVGVIVGHPDGCTFLEGVTWEAPIERDELLEKSIKIKELAEFLIDYLGPLHK